MSIKKLLICAGAMKAGTSYLYKMLERHAQIEVTPVKEIHYFAHLHTPLTFLDDAARLHALKSYVAYLDAGGDVTDARRKLKFFARYLRGPVDDAWYERLFRSEDDVYKADFSNMAAVLPEDGLRHMCRIGEDLRVLYVMRDPAARLWSHVKFHAAVNGELWRLDGFAPGDFTQYIEASGAAAQGRYAENIARMLRSIPADRLKVLYFEDLVMMPRETLGSIFDFLGLAPIALDDDELSVVHNPGPAAGMPESFVEAARALLSPLRDQLADAGIAAHPRWGDVNTWAAAASRQAWQDTASADW